MVSTAEFLSHVLPSQGKLCWIAIKKGGAPKQGFVDDVGALAAVLRDKDAADPEIYFGCASGDGGGRRKTNITFAKAFWLDLDVGEGKPYADVDEALDATDAFLEATGLPTPTVVYSGYGAHLWWALDKEIEKDEWEPAAEALGELCAKHGLDVDRSRTKDIASILRAPGTTNKKFDTKKEVLCELLEPCVSYTSLIQKIAPSRVPAVSDMGLGTAILGGLADRTFEPSSGALVAEHCLQIRAFRDIRGNVSEPLWYASLGLLAYCTDGEALAQEWSSGHPAYDPTATAKKLQQAREKQGPTTCARLCGLNPKGCTGCPHSVTSPIQLGRGQTVTAPAPALEIPEESRPMLPAPFKWGKNMELIHEGKDQDGEVSTTTVSETPVYLHRARRRHGTEKESYEFRKLDPHTGWRSFTLDGATLAGLSWPVAFGEVGIHFNVHEQRYFKLYITAAIKLAIKRGHMESFESFGWKHDHTAFAIGEKLYKGDAEPEEIAVHGIAAHFADYLAPKPKGSLQAWRVGANRLFGPGFEAQSFALVASFAAPLMTFAVGENTTEGGMILTLFNTVGASGKTSMLEAIASPWGRFDALNLSNRDTTNAKFKHLGMICHMPALFDEFDSRDHKVALEFALGFTGGRDKNALNQKREMTEAPVHWTNFMITTQNRSMVELIRQNGSAYDAMADRVMELNVEVPEGMTFSHHKAVFSDLIENAGHAGPAFMRLITKPQTVAWIKAQLPIVIDHIAATYSLGPKFRFQTRGLACIYLAAQLLTRTGLLEFDAKRLFEYGIKQLKMRAEDAYIGGDPLDALMMFVSQYFRGILYVDGPPNASRNNIIFDPIPTQGLIGRMEKDSKRLYISAAHFRIWLAEKGLSYKSVIADLEKREIILNRNRNTTLAGGTHFSASRLPCIEVDMAIPAVSGVLVEVGKEKVAQIVKLA